MELNIILENIGKHFNREWVFRNINQTLLSNESYAILGANGAGKSTLLQLIASNLSPSIGKISYVSAGETSVDPATIFKQISLVAPYLELIEEFSLEELIHFHFQFKKYLSGWGAEAVIDLLKLRNASSRALKYFSSGMKQRVKLALAFCSDTPILLLDEPTTNLDNQGFDWYLSLVEQLAVHRLTVVCSNQEQEYQFCKHHILLDGYKDKSE